MAWRMSHAPDASQADGDASLPRADIANLLLATETVSRVLGRFGAQQLIEIQGRELQLANPHGMHQIGQALLPD